MPSASAPSKVAERAKPEGAIARCGGKSRQTGDPCKLVAGYGTDHVGYGHCKWHGGCTPNGVKHAARLRIGELHAELGADQPIEPHAAIEKALGGANAWLEFCRHQATLLDPEAIVVQHVRRREWEGTSQQTATQGGGSETIVEPHAELHIWVREYQRALRDLAQLAKVAVDAGIEERRVQLAERAGAEIAQLIGALYAIAEPYLDAAGKKLFQETTRAQLIALEGGSAS